MGRKFVDLTGQRFGKLFVIDRVDEKTSRKIKIRWNCVCDCGNISKVLTHNLIRGFSRSCGSCGYIDLSGKRFERIEVLNKSGIDKFGNIIWECKCDCGKEFHTITNSLMRGKTTSCGCLNREILIEKVSLPFGESSYNKYYREYKRNAETRDLLFNITIDFFKTITSKNCYYCNASPIYREVIKNRRKDFIYCNGIDRIDNSIGYEENNCVPCCTKCNYAKNAYSVDEFLILVKNIYENLKLDKYKKEEK